MKNISLVLSLFVLAHLSLDLVNIESAENKSAKSNAEAGINIPQPLGNSLLAIEKKWLAIQQEANSPKQEITTKPEVNKHNFMIGGNSYHLLGIFSEQNGSFVLLKDNKNDVIKLKQDDVLPGGYTLAEINANIIAFVVNNERVEFKLFETKSHAKN